MATKAAKKPAKTAAKAARVIAPVAELSEPVKAANDEPVAPRATNLLPLQVVNLTAHPVTEMLQVQQPMQDAPKAEPFKAKNNDELIYGMLTVLALAVAIGAYAVLYTVLEQLYHGLGAAARALVPLAVEMIMGFAVHRLIGAKRGVLAAGAMLIILGCAATEIDAAHNAPEIAKRERVTHVLDQPMTSPEVKAQSVANDNVGRQGNLQIAQNAGKALDLTKERYDDARTDHQAALDNAKAEVPGEERIAIELAILGAIGSSCFIPLLEAFLRARRQRKA